LGKGTWLVMGRKGIRWDTGEKTRTRQEHWDLLLAPSKKKKERLKDFKFAKKKKVKGPSLSPTAKKKPGRARK